MKNLLTLIALLLVVGVQGGHTQKKQYSDYNIRKAIEYIDENNLDGAMQSIEAHIQEFPTQQPQAYLVRAFLYKEKMSFDQALMDVDRFIKYNKNKDKELSFRAYRFRGEIYMNMDENDKAIAAFSDALKYAKSIPDKRVVEDVQFMMAHIYYEQKKYELADEIYNDVLRDNPVEQTAMVGLARNMIMREEHQQAVNMLNSCEKYDKDYDQIYRFRAQAYDKLRETDKAIDDAIEYYYRSNNVDLALVEAIFKKHLNYALAKVSERVNNDIDNRYNWLMLKTSTYELGYDYIGAIETYNQMEKEFGETFSITYYRAQSYAEIDNYERAITDMMKCVEETGEKDYSPVAYLADFYRMDGQFDEAIKWFSKLIDIEPTDAFGYYRRGWCYELMGNDEEAMKNYNMGIDIDDKYPYIYLMRGEQYLKRGDREKANADFEEIIKRDTVADSSTCRMYALHFLGRDVEAIEWMDQVIENDPDEKGNYYDQACLYARMGKSQESVVALRTAFEKGYRTFAHIEADDDLDSVRELPEFKALIEEYKAKPIRIEEEEVENTSSDLIASTSEVQMRKMRSGVYEVPCTINDLPLKFIFDTGASTTTISSVEADFMLKNGYLKENDIRGKEYYSTATGEIHEGTIIRLREIKIGDAVLRNVNASVTHSQQAPLLLGQSVMERFGTITIDNTTSKLTIKQK